MLLGLDIKNIALIEKLNIEVKEGMTVLTGETGAGKSIIIDAVNLLLGARSNKNLVRYGEEKASVQDFLLFYLIFLKLLILVQIFLRHSFQKLQIKYLMN